METVETWDPQDEPEDDEDVAPTFDQGLSDEFDSALD